MSLLGLLSAASLDMRPRTTSNKAASSVTHNDEYAFFADLDAPAPERKRRKVYMPEGNANNPDKATRHERQVAARRARRQHQVAERQPSARTIKRRTDVDTSKGEVLAAAAQVDYRGAAERISRALPRMAAQATEPVKEKKASAHFTVHVGSFPSFEEAATAMKGLRAQGLAPHVTLTNNEGEGKIYRVRVGRYSTREEARIQIQTSGLRGAIVGL